MASVTVTCPHCGLSKQVEESVLPSAGATVTCPKCQGQFRLQLPPPAKPGSEEGLPYPSPPPAAAAVDASAAPPGSSAAIASPLPGAAAAPSPFAALTGAGEPAPPSSPLVESATPDVFRTLTFTFTGNAKEYFGIWIVNTLLRIVTLGLYSPWAKVRKRRYFYGNTLLDDAPFDYLADPLAILKGWLLAGAFFGLYSFLSRTSPIGGTVMMILFSALYPWVVVRARIFTLRNSSHRNIRFSFKRNYREAYKVYLWLPLLMLLTLGILAPYVVYRQKRFLVENSSYGTTPFKFEAKPRQYYKIFFPLLILVPLGIVSIVWGMGLAKGGGAQSAGAAVVPVLFLIIYLLAALYLPTAISNTTWNATRIGGHSFDCNLRFFDLAWIYASSTVAIICTLGLLTPWASVRLARYRLGKLVAYGEGALDSVIAAPGEAMGATGEELGDMLGFDIGL